ncbi:MAG TPA: FAD-dependent oxidoreductase [Candidatus Polarisedimenticolaceae bacterium]|nr:FAD-dependent oxidoreductase [Candidatus Polarisedimenticolaceae bacterium]
MANRHTVIVGGGIVGLSSAYFLARRGERVTVVERDTPGRGASSGNAGILALGHPPLPHPNAFRQIRRLLFRKTNPLYIAPRADPELLRWLWSFRRACARERFEHSMELLARMGWAAGECIRRLVADEGIDCEYSPSGWLEVFRTRQAMDRARRTADLLRRHGYTVTALDGDALRQREPAFRDEVVGAMHYEDSAFAHPAKLMVGLADRVRKLGVDFLTEAEVVRITLRSSRFTGVELADGQRIDADRAVLAAGAWTTPLARSIGVRVPMQAGKGYHLELRATAHRPSTTCVLAETFVAVTPLDGGLRLAGTVELAGLDLTLNRRRLAMLPRGAADYLRGIDRAELGGSWCGLRPMTADGLPVLGWAPGVEGVFVATGHAMMGFLLGPLSGKLVAEAIVDGRMSLDAPELAPARF